MAIIRPFKGIRPSKDKVHLITSRSFDTYDPDVIQDKLKNNPFSFLQIIMPDGFRGNGKPKSKEKLKSIKLRFKDFIKNSYLNKDENASFYIYQQISNGSTFTGIIGCVSVDDYLNGVIKTHEKTLEKREEKMVNYLQVVDINAEPVCLTYPDNKGIDKIISQCISALPEYDFTTTNSVRHKFWLIEEKLNNEIIKRFGKIKSVYVADGHHRSASSALLGQKSRVSEPKGSADAGYNFFMSILIPFSQIRMYAYNRMVRDLNGLSKDAFIARLSRDFDIENKGNSVFQPSCLHEFGMYLDGSWYRLNAKSTICEGKDVASCLDSKILSQHILSPILNITDISARTSDRICFIGGVDSSKETVLQEKVDSGEMKIAFSLFPVTIDQLVNVADAGMTMPPKSTWVEPKLRTGLVVYDLSE